MCMHLTFCNTSANKSMSKYHTSFLTKHNYQKLELRAQGEFQAIREENGNRMKLSLNIT